jgi:hypothetical protein
MAPHSAFDEEFWLDIREELRRSDAEIFSDDASTPDEVTHYTSFAGLNGIIDRREMWCTDLREVDDNRECDYGMNVIQSVITRKSVPQQFVQPVLRAKSLFGAKDRFTYFVSCFCSSGHEESRMWDRYAENGAGFAIVFDAKRLFAGADGGKAYAFEPVIYDEAIQVDKTGKVIDRAIQLQREGGMPASALERYWSKEVQFCLLVCGLRFKAPCWQYQREVRIAVAESDSLNCFVHAGKTRVAVPFKRPAVIRIARGPKSTGIETKKRALRENLICGPFYAAFCKTMNSVLVTAMR